MFLRQRECKEYRHAIPLHRKRILEFDSIEHESNDLGVSRAEMPCHVGPHFRSSLPEQTFGETFCRSQDLVAQISGKGFRVLRKTLSNGHEYCVTTDSS